MWDEFYYPDEDAGLLPGVYLVTADKRECSYRENEEQ